MNQFLKKKSGPYSFVGVTNGVSAVNVIAAGHERVGVYVGGWQTNAMRNRLHQLLPDTLYVSLEEASVQAEEINSYMRKTEKVRELHYTNDPVIYDKFSLLADLEQGWSCIHKTREAVRLAIHSGINMIHIEDQGVQKRCGHLGDKELHSIDHFVRILRAVQATVHEELGDQKDRFRIIARTDALSATRIMYHHEITDPQHPEHQFVDWTRKGYGHYLFLKKGINPSTGQLWGMDLAIQRCVRVYGEGLCDHLWIETPDGDLDIARQFIQGVRAHHRDVTALYNFSPSFDWGKKFSTTVELEQFSDELYHMGYVLHLVTLPEFHILAYHMYMFSDRISMTGAISAYVDMVQNPEKKLANCSLYRFLWHQTATGTGLEAQFAKRIGDENINILSESTERCE